MALGGGTFVTQNKVLPGAYINFVSKAGANVFGERGTGCLALDLNWYGDDLVEVTFDECYKNCESIFGYSYNSDKMIDVREFFKHGTKLIAGSLNTGGTKAKTATDSYVNVIAKKYGDRGNQIRVTVSPSLEEGRYDVYTYLAGRLVDSQANIKSSELVDNDFVEFKNPSFSDITQTVTKELIGGANGNLDTGEKFLEKAEKKSFNAIGICYQDNGEILQAYNSLIAVWTKNMRDNKGIKFQSVVKASEGELFNYEGVVSVRNDFIYNNHMQFNTAWVVGALAGCQVNKSLTNTTYDGEMTLKSDYSQSDLEKQLKKGFFLFHRVGDETRVLEDINSFTGFTEEKGELFQSNQTIRVIDQIAVDIAAIFNNYYLGKVPNDKQGRISFKTDIVKHHRELETLRAIEDFNSDDVIVEQGNSKGSVIVNENITVINTMDKLYMTVNIE